MWNWFGPCKAVPLPPLLGPEVVGRASSDEYLRGILAESKSILDEPPSAEYEAIQRSQRPPTPFTVYRRPVAGAKGLTMARLEAEVPMSADDLFKLMISMPGKCIVDPFPKEHHSELVKPLRLLKGEASVVFSEAPRFIGVLRPREYVTCDVAAPAERLFVCKSCKVEDGPLAAPRKGHVRANLLFAMRVRECTPMQAGAPARCHMQMINWLDLGRDTVPTWLANSVTERWFFPALMRRLNKYSAQHGLVGGASSHGGASGRGGVDGSTVLQLPGGS